MNITVDDNLGDENVLVYQPSDQWLLGPTCTRCQVKPDVKEAFNLTWHDTSVSGQQVSNMTLKFTGTYG
jgi:hypothetical protein